MPDDLGDTFAAFAETLDESALRVLEGRADYYARKNSKKSMHPATRNVIEDAVAKRKAVAMFVAMSEHETRHRRIGEKLVFDECQVVSEIEETQMADNEVEIWKSTAEVRAAKELLDSQTQNMVAENALGIVEQQQAEAHRQHERELEKQRLANEHEIAKLSTIDVSTEQEREHNLATQRHDAVVARQKGLIKGLIVGASVGISCGFGAGLAIGLLF